MSDQILKNLKRDAIADQMHDALLDAIGDARYILLGEATHGTHEFYMQRAQITKRLIEEKGFNIIALEADWPAALNINHFIQHPSKQVHTALEALRGFKTFPSWMWRNVEMLEFIEWLAEYNQQQQQDKRTGIYGLDLYSLHESINAVISYLRTVDPAMAREATRQYACFDHAGPNPQDYGFNVEHGLVQSCARVAQDQLRRLQESDYYITSDHAIDDLFFAEQNACVVVSAEQYYRSMFNPHISSWNLRDTHMADTVDALVAHYQAQQRKAKIVIWAHNSHIGDARATQAGQQAEINIGQLMRERHGANAYLVGFTTYNGTVAAADDWDMPVKLKRVRNAIAGSYEHIFHEVGHEQFLLLLHDTHKRLIDFERSYLERAIGVIYHPETELQSHYFQVRIEDQFNAVIHIDQTKAVQPVDRSSEWKEDQVDQTYPVGL